MKSILLVLALLGASAAYASSNRGGGIGPTKGGDGNDVPTPFTSNQKVELADGEDYTLIGKIEIYGDYVYFVVDLSEHPWLANAKRRANPVFPVRAMPAVLEQYDGIRVKMPVRASGRILVDNSNQHAEYVIALIPTGEPVRYDWGNSQSPQNPQNPQNPKSRKPRNSGDYNGCRPR